MTEPTESSFLRRVQAGDRSAQAAVFEDFASKLQAVVSKKLDRRLRRLIDAEDVVQSAFRSLFRRIDAQQVEMRSVSNLWHLLVTIAARRCFRHARNLMADKRDVRKTVSTTVATEDGDAPLDLLATDPTPDQIAETREILQMTLESLDEVGVGVLLMELQDYTEPEIAAKLQCSERTVRRKKQIYRARLQELDSLPDSRSAIERDRSL